MGCKGSAYNQNSTEAQKFSVKGTVALPDGVTNPDNLSLVVSVNVTVSRGSIVSDAGNNSITGISSDGTILQRPRLLSLQLAQVWILKIRLREDVRYQPLNWEVLEARSWDGAPVFCNFPHGQEWKLYFDCHI